MDKTKSKELQTQSKTSLIPRCIEVQNETDIVIFERNLTINDSFNTPPIKELKGKVTDKALLTAVTHLVMRASKSNSIYKEIDDKVAVQLAVDLLEQFEYDSLNDIILMFKYARQGKLELSEYSKKKSFAETVLFDWFSSYMKLKAEVRETIKLQDSEKLRGSMKWHPKSLEAIRKIRMDFEANRKSKAPLTPASEHLSMESITLQFKEQAKELSEQELKMIIKYWLRDNVKKHYVHVFESELKNRKK